MAITTNFNGASLRQPGAYSKSRVILSGGFPLAATGVVALVGEAEGGEPGSSAGVQTYTSEDIGALIATYKSGPIVDAARLLTSPDRDARVPNGASFIRVYKTNASTKSALAVESTATGTLFNMQSANYGSDENLVSVFIESPDANQKTFKIKKGTSVENLGPNPADEMLSVLYTGADVSSDYTVTNISGVKTLQITTPSTPADDISIPLPGKTIQDVVDLISSHASYTCTTSFRRSESTPAASLDYVTSAEDTKAAAYSAFRLQQEMLNIINGESTLVTASLAGAVEGIPLDSTAPQFLTGGAKGASLNSSFQSAFDALLATRVNTVVPLISRDASVLAAEGKTDSTSTFTIDAVNLQAVTHCITASNTKNRSERNCYLSYKGTFATSREKAEDLGSERASVLFQDVLTANSAGDLETFEPWAAAAMLAGIQAGTEVGTPATKKVINAIGITHADYNAGTQADLAIDSGLLPLKERDQGGISVVVHNTSYGADPNFVFNRVSVLEAADFVAYNMRQQLDAIFVGTKVSNGLATSVSNTVRSIMNSFLTSRIIVGDDTNAGLGYKDLTVNVSGNVVNIDITITPVQGVDFVLSTIRLDTIQQTA